MNLEEYHTLFIVATLGLALIVASPALAVFVPLQIGSEKFSEFWLLGPDQVAEGYPSNVRVGEDYKVFVGVGNHMGGSEYYMVRVKFRNITQIRSDIGGSVPSSSLSLYDYRFFVIDEDVLEFPLSFGFGDVVVEGNVLVLGAVIFEGVSFPVDASVVWDVEGAGFVFQFFFELWRYDMVSKTFRFDDLSVGLWLNMTVS